MPNDEKLSSRLVRSLPTLVKWSVVIAIIAGVAYWMRFAPISVTTSAVRRGPISAEVMGTGTLEARVSMTIGPKISGRITTVAADQGDRVREGELLVELDAEELQQQVAIAEANVAAAEAAIVRLGADKERSSAVLSQSQRTHQRLEELLKRSATSQEEFENSMQAVSVAVADVARAEAAISEGQESLLAAQQTLLYHQARLQDTRLLAPFDGLITTRHREAGDVVVPGSGILTLISTDMLWIRAWVDETQMSQVREGQSARVVFRSEPDQSFDGKVIRLARESDRETREFIVDVQATKLPENWAIGQRADVFLTTQRKAEAIQIDAELLIKVVGGYAVFVNDSATARLQPVELGIHGRDAIEIVSGLEEGEQLIWPNSNGTKLNPGRRITVAQP